MECEVCGKKAIYRFSPDMDIEGLGACKKHKRDMMIAFIILWERGEKEYFKYLKSLKLTK
jgi:hypothetical protein